jgi:branched-chain amino acid transport system ATP-binding protein
MIERIFEIIRLLNERGLPILLIEQNVLLSLEVSSRAYVMERGRITLQGPSAELRRDPHVEQAYLGI